MSSSDTWHFVVLGDTQNIGKNTSNPIRAAIINSIVENNPNLKFILHAGDIVQFGGEQDDWDRYFEDIENATKNDVKFYYSVGNHDQYTYSGLIEEDWATYLTNVDLPGNERYYSFDYNDQIHFIIINTDEYRDKWDDPYSTFNISAEQQSWILNDLETNTIDFVIAVFHRPCYSINYYGVTAAREQRRVLEPILVDFDVDLVFSGHLHYYHRTIRKSIVHVVTGGGGTSLINMHTNSDWKIGDEYSLNYHYCNITVVESEENLTVRVDMLKFNMYDKSTTLDDSFQIYPNPIETTEINMVETTTTTETITKTTTMGTTPNPFIPMMMGIVVIVFLRKIKK